jgi:hypothetical protein
MLLATNQQGKPLDGLRLLLMHHPFTDLADGAQCRRLLRGHADLVLRGHLHEPEVETWADPDRTVRQAAAGCLYEGHYADRYGNSCQVLTLGLGAGGRLQDVKLHFRAWSARGGHWHDDDSLYRETKQGRLTWLIARPSIVAGKSANPYDPWTPAMPPRFVGRGILLRHLDRALEEGRSVSLVGDWRIGKSSVLQTWAGQVRERGRVVRLLSGEGPEGVSPGALVSAIVGTTAPDGADAAADLLDRWAAHAAPAGLPPLLLIENSVGWWRASTSGSSSGCAACWDASCWC